MERSRLRICARETSSRLSGDRAPISDPRGGQEVRGHAAPEAAPRRPARTRPLLASMPRAISVVRGTQQAGQPCRFSVECKNGLACVGYRPGVDGTCKKPAAPKEACTSQPYGSILNEAAARVHLHPACVPGAYCDGTTCQPRVLPARRAVAGRTCARRDCSCVMEQVRATLGDRSGVRGAERLRLRALGAIAEATEVPASARRRGARGSRACHRAPARAAATFPRGTSVGPPSRASVPRSVGRGEQSSLSRRPCATHRVRDGPSYSIHTGLVNPNGIAPGRARNFISRSPRATATSQSPLASVVV